MAVEARRQLVGLLSGLGMSTRAIAPVVGVSKDTVYRDQVYQADTPAAHERIDPRTGEVIPPPARGASGEVVNLSTCSKSSPRPPGAPGGGGERFPLS